MALTGDVYACEWELFQVDSNVGSLQFAGQDVKIMYSTDGCETWNTYSKMGEAIAITAGDNNWVNICVTEGFDVRDKKDKESFTVTATLA